MHTRRFGMFLLGTAALVGLLSLWLFADRAPLLASHLVGAELTPPTASVPPGGSSTYALTLTPPAAGAGGWVVDISYNSTLVTASCPATGGAGSVCNPNAGNLSKVRVNGDAYPGLTTATNIANITFTASAGAAVGTNVPLTVTIVELITDQFVPITGTATSAALSITAVSPGNPTAVQATAGNGQATVTWTAPTSDGGSAITSYTVTSSPGNITAALTCPCTAPLSKVVTGLTNGTSYTFKVTAINSAGGTDSAPSNAVTPAAAVVSPGNPTAVQATAGNGQATVTWTAPTSDGGSAITSYTVTSSPSNITATLTCPCTAPLSKVVTGLANGTSYTFKVTAINSAGGTDSTPSNAATPTPGATVTPATGGGAISAGTAATGGTGAYTALTGPVITEGGSGDIGVGEVHLFAPAGFGFNTSGSPAIGVAVGPAPGGACDSTYGLLAGAAATFHGEHVVISITRASSLGNVCQVTVSGLQVRPTLASPLASGNITQTTPAGISNAVIAGVTPNVTSFGALIEVAAPPTGAVVRIEPTVRRLGVGGTGSVSVVASLPVGTSLGAWTIDLPFDPLVVDAASCGVTVLGATAVCNPDYPGNIVRVSGIHATGLTGTITLATITFQALGVTGTSATLTPAVVTFTDPAQNAIPVSTEAGSITVGSPCDANLDGSIDAVDALRVLRFVVGLEGLAAGLGDANGDGLVDAVDALFILRNVVGLQTGC